MRAWLWSFTNTPTFAQRFSSNVSKYLQSHKSSLTNQAIQQRSLGKGGILADEVSLAVFGLENVYFGRYTKKTSIKVQI